MDAGEISQVFQQCGADKFEHGYAPIYAGVPNDILLMAEIGVANGHSLKAWLQIFPKAKIYGIDKNPTMGWSDNRITIIHSSFQTMPLNPFGWHRYDLIVDDGSHILDEQIRALRCFFPFLHGGGTYVIEDVIAENAEPLRHIAHSHLRAWVKIFETGPHGDDRALVIRHQHGVT